MCDENLLITEFENTESAIVFAKNHWEGFENIPETMREVDAELGEDKRWFCVIGICDICGVEEVSFVPACVYDDGITGIECYECGNMSVYPQEEEANNES